MILLDHTIKLPSYHSTATIIPFGCVHADDEGFAADLWDECLETIRTTPTCYAFGLGDYKSFVRTHYRNHITAYRGDEDSQRDIDNLVEAEAKKFARKYLLPIKHKLWGLAEGNHHWQFMDGTTDTQLLCRLVGVPYLGKASGHRIRLVTPQATTRVLKMVVHHGDWSGGGSTLGGDVNALARRAEAFGRADIFVAGHTHQKWGVVVPDLDFTDKGKLRIMDRPRAFIRGGSFTKGYLETCITYAERKMLKPTALGFVTLTMKLKQRYDVDRYRRLRLAGKSPREASKGPNLPPEIEMKVLH